MTASPAAGRCTLVANPVAGGGRARAAAVLAARLLDEQGTKVDLQWTIGPGHATQLARTAIESGARCVVGCGGDGTLNEVAAGLMGTGVPLGVVPAGRGNDFAAAIGLPRTVEGAVEVVRHGSPHAVDVGRVNGRPFLTVAAAGFDAEVAERVLAGAFRMLGRHAYVAGALRLLLQYRASEMVIRGDFGERRGRYLLVATGNTDRYGGGVRITPGAEPHDGRLQCCLVRDLPRLRALRLLPSTFTGAHVRYPEVEMLQSSTLEVEAHPPVAVAADGEMMGRTPITIGTDPRALSVMVAPGKEGS